MSGLGHTERDSAVTIGVGRKIEKSLVIPGGGTKFTASKEGDEGASGGMDEFEAVDEEGDGTAKRLAYRRSNLDRDGDGSGSRTEKLDWPMQESWEPEQFVKALSIVECDIGVAEES